MKLVRILPLLVLLPAVISSCTATEGDPPTDGTVTICGVAVTAFEDGETDTAARECFFEAYKRAEAAQLFVVDTRFVANHISGTVWTTVAGQLAVLTAEQEQSSSPSPFEWSCSALEATSDGTIFRATGCTDPAIVPVPAGDAATADGMILTCGAEVVVHSREHYNRDARHCFRDAFETGNSARFFSTKFTIEGGPITEIYTITADAEIDVFLDSRDGWGVYGIFAYRCTTLVPGDAPEVWRTAGCTDPEPR